MKNNQKEVKRVKKKLKRRGKELYNKYFYNSPYIIDYIINQYDSQLLIDESKCEVVFNISEDYNEKIYELILYYPKTLKKIKFITNTIVDELYYKFGETINIMKSVDRKVNNVRGKMAASAQCRAKLYNIECDLTSEDIILVKECKFLNIPLVYGSNKHIDTSPSLDRIDSSKGYTKDNIQVISDLANRMKSSANKEQLIIFAENILKQYKDVTTFS